MNFVLQSEQQYRMVRGSQMKVMDRFCQRVNIGALYSSYLGKGVPLSFLWCVWLNKGYVLDFQARE